MKAAHGLRGVVAGALLGAALAIGGCDLSGEAVSADCTRIGAQCQLPSGPLGVCQERPCEPGKSGPCFTCTSQH